MRYCQQCALPKQGKAVSRQRRAIQALSWLCRSVRRTPRGPPAGAAQTSPGICPGSWLGINLLIYL